MGFAPAQGILPQPLDPGADPTFNSLTLTSHLLSPIVRGGTGAGAELKLETTSNATKGFVSIDGNVRLYALSNTLIQANSTNAQAYYTYGMVDNPLSPTNYERMEVVAGATAHDLISRSGGTGTVRPLRLQTIGSSNIDFLTNGTLRHRIAGGTGHFFPTTDNTYDYGDASFRPRNIYAGTQFIGNGSAPVTAPAFAFSGQLDEGMTLITNSTVAICAAGNERFRFDGANARYTIPSSYSFAWSSTSTSAGSPDLFLFRDTANTLAQRDGANAQAYHLYNTFTDASNNEYVALRFSGNQAQLVVTRNGTGSNRELAFGTSSSVRWVMQTAGHWVANSDNALDIGASGANRPRTGYFGTALVVGTNPASSGSIRLANNAELRSRDFANAADVIVCKVGTDDAVQIAPGGASIRLRGSITIDDAKDFTLNATTGTKIGTATTQKLGFWNATPVVQPAHIADPAGGSTVDAEARTAINAINAVLAATGLTAAS